MTQGLLIRSLICIFVLGSLLYRYIDKQNDLTELKMRIPKLVKCLRKTEEENAQLLCDIESLERPEQLMEWMRCPEFSHLKHPTLTDVVTVHEE